MYEWTCWKYNHKNIFPAGKNSPNCSQKLHKPVLFCCHDFILGEIFLASGGGGKVGGLLFYTTNFIDLQLNYTQYCTQSVKVFESDLLENVQVVAAKAGHFLSE